MAYSLLQTHNSFYFPTYFPTMSAVVRISMPRRAFVASLTVPNGRRANIFAMATTFKVTFVNKEGQEKTIDCRDDDYILDAADAGGVDLPASCRGK